MRQLLSSPINSITRREFANIARQQASKPPPPVSDYTKSSTLPPPTKPLPIIKSPYEATPEPQDARFGARDPARGREAALKVAQGGKLDARYKPAARRVLAIIVALPFVVALSYELFQRQFNGKQRKRNT